MRRKHSPPTTKEKNSGTSLTGIVSVTRRGVGYFSHPDFDEDVEIAPRDLNTALNKDTVAVQLHSQEKGKRIRGEVTRVLLRATTTFVGILEKERGHYFLKPDDKRMYADILIVKTDKQKIAKDTKALVQLFDWNDPKRSPEGKILEIIGKKGLHETEMRSIVLGHGFETEFQKKVEQEAKEIGRQKNITNQEISERRDLRNTTTFTIDPKDAKDFDDALSIQELPDGTVEIGVHIADVSHYVKPGSAIDNEARKRATSVYLVDRTIPMLPEILSNDVCSLNPHEDKLTYSAIFVLNKESEVKKRWFGKTIIHSNKRFTYEDAQEVLDKKGGDFHTELLLLDRLAKKMRDKRFKNGAIDFDQEEISFTLDKEGKPISINKKVRQDTNRMIEEYMLLANQEVATHFQKLCKKLPASRATFLYRVHDVPNPEKIEELEIFLNAIGYDFKTHRGEVTGRELRRLFKSIKGKPEENLIKTATIRSMAKAIYSTKNIGHFGLSFAYYTHFTSPIRRYPDIMVHRILKNHLGEEPLAQQEIDQYESLALQSSRQEIEAVKAERESIKFKQVEYMKEHIGESFGGIITGVVEWGLYVEEENTKAEGLVRIATLKNDFYELDRKRYRLTGTRTKKSYVLGDKVSIRLVSANLEDKTIEWTLIDNKE